MAKAPTFSLDDLVVERPGLEFQGVRYEAALPKDFDLVTEAQRIKLTRDMAAIEPRIQKDAGDQEAMEELKQILGDIIHIYFPKLPQDIIDIIPSNKRVEIIHWWGETCFPQAFSRLEPPQMGPRPAATA